MRRVCVVVLLAATVAASCGDGSTAGCIEIREPADPLSIQHVLDPEGVTFLTDPPTSGPHLSGPIPTGLMDAPLAGAVQVQVLEVGGVVVQYGDTITQAELLPLLDADDEIDGVPLTVAPGVDLPSPVVATAWTWKLTCGSPDLDAIRTFAAARSTDAPESLPG